MVPWLGVARSVSACSGVSRFELVASSLRAARRMCA